MVYKLTAYVIAVLHLSIICANMAAIPLLIWNEPFYIAMPLITLLVSPLLSGSYCLFNNLENYFRVKAGMKPIHDRISHLLGKEN